MQESDLDMAEDELQTPDELTTLKARADQMGITYHPSIKVEKLREKIAAKLAGEEEPNKDGPVVVKKPRSRARKKDDAPASAEA